MKKRILAALLVSALAISAAGCGAQEAEEPEPTESMEAVIVNVEDTEPEEEATETEVEETATIPGGMAVNKLTGEWIDESIAEQRPFACMIENGEGDLPFYGVSKADIIYEALAESNITRMMGIWQDYEDVSKIGTVRSCRSYYAAASKEYQANYGHWGLSLFAVPTLSTLKGYDMDGMGGSASYPNQIRDNSPALNIFSRESGRASVHSVVVDTSKIKSAIESNHDKYKYELNTDSDLPAHFNFVSNPNTIYTLDDFSDAEDAIVVVPGGFTDKKRYFVYDEESGKYMAFQKGTKQIDELTGEQLTQNYVMKTIAGGEQ